MPDWVWACKSGSIEHEDLIRWEHKGRNYAIFRITKGYFCTSGMCTHEEQHLEDGLVDGEVIECPLHQGRFNVISGKALSAPVCEDLETFPVKVENDDVYVFV